MAKKQGSSAGIVDPQKGTLVPKKSTPSASPSPSPSSKSSGGASDYAKNLGSSFGIGASKTGAGVNDWKLIPATWTSQQISQYQTVLWNAGAYGNTKKQPIAGLWDPNVDGSALKQALGFVQPKSDNPTLRTWQGVLNTMAANPTVFQSHFATGGGTSDGTVSRKDTAVSALSDSDAEDLVQKNFLSVMGRMPNPTELKTYAKKLQDAVIANPTQTSTSSTYKNGKLVATKSLQSGGLNANQFVLQSIKKDAPTLIKSDRAAGLSDTASATLASLTKTAYDYGMNVPDQHLLDLTDSIAKGKVQVADAESYLKNMAATAFPAFSDQILNKGLTVSQIASPYMSSMAKILELNPDSISLNDPLVRGALSAKDASGKPVATSLFDFEKQLRNDPRWLKTQNAQQTIMDQGLQVARDMGVAY